MAGKRAAERTEEKAVTAQIAGRVRKPGDDGAVTLSGRCGAGTCWGRRATRSPAART